MTFLLVTVAGFLLDLAVGDPQGWWHPVRSIGWLVTALEGKLRRCFPGHRCGELAAGAVLVLLVLTATGVAAAGVLALAWRLHPWPGILCMCLMCGQIFAARSLKTESCKVYKALEGGDVEEARTAVSMIVGRDTAVLSREGIIRAAVETVAENASDGVIAPLCYMLLLGPVGGMLYKAVNTMDSMVGYKNERYLYFGRTAAKFDDVVNWFPARLSAVLMVCAGGLLGMDAGNAWRIYVRDRYNHSSPNSAHTEAVTAGALHIQLAGNAYYFGKLYEKPTLGDADRPVEYEDIRRAGRLLYGTAVLALLVFLAVKGVVLWVI